MENLRVYEAARKLNIETSELMARLAARGVTVTGPIDTVTQKDFDTVAEELRNVAQATETEATAEAAPAPAPVLRLAPREDTPETPVASKETVEEKPAEPPHHAKSHHTTPAPHHHPKPSKAPTALSFAAIGLAALALLLAVGIYSSVKEQGAGIATLTTQAAATDAALKTASLNADTALAMSVNNTTRIAQAEQARIAGELTRRSVALDELSAGLPTAQGERVAELARRLDQLARSL